MPQATIEDVDAITQPTTPTTKGNSRYVLVPADWPQDARVRLVLLNGKHP